ncbi:LamG domain-containing protein [Streptomyces sp. SM12]|uniref:LamG domain-containing protein n=1 Tax=Streptomyces sp. SM12 TaxID=1071602 RepID=UPI000CD4FFF0|nr:LamG domain-containing protein [Streptomyces sp. SM12]
MARRIRLSGLRATAVAGLCAVALLVGVVPATAVAPAQTTASFTGRIAAAPAPPQISSDRFPESDPGDPLDGWHQGAGHYGTFTFTSGDDEVTRYRYGVNNDPHPANVVPTVAGASRSVQVLPDRPGVHRVTAQAINASGRVSAPATYFFRVGAGEQPRALWAFDDDAGAEHALPETPVHEATLHGGATPGVPGAVGGALELDGATGYAARTGHVVDTGRPFTVAAWARLDASRDDASVVLQQSGRHATGFMLHHVGDSGRWAFSRSVGDTAGSALDTVVAEVPSTVGEWVHLVGSYDGTRLRLFVDGRLAGETPHTSGWTAQGSFRIGAERDGAAVTGHFPGAIDEVRLFDYAMVAEADGVDRLHDGRRVEQAPGRPALSVFALDESAGASTVTGRGDARPAVFHGGVTTGVPGMAGTAAAFNGVDGYARTAAGPVDTAGDFAISAWARLDKDLVDGSAVVATHAGEHAPGPELSYSVSADRWSFGHRASDAPGAAGVSATQPDGVRAQDGRWVHLTGVHDSVEETLTLHVNGRQAGSVPYTGAWTARGPFLIGAGGLDGDLRGYFPGEIDDLRIHGRVLGGEEIERLAARAPVLAGHWPFDDGAAATPDVSPFANDLALHGGTAFGEGWWAGALLLDGADGHARTTVVPIDTSDSFTVAAWARLDRAPDGPVTLLSLAGAERDAMVIRVVPDPEEPDWGLWQVTLASEDSPDAISVTVEHGHWIHTGSWHHIAVVYDAATQRAELYLDEWLMEVVCDEDDGPECVPAASWADGVFPFAAEDSLQVGRARTSDGWGEYWPGAVDDLHVFQGTLGRLQFP